MSLPRKQRIHVLMFLCLKKKHVLMFSCLSKNYVLMSQKNMILCLYVTQRFRNPLYVHCLWLPRSHRNP